MKLLTLTALGLLATTSIVSANNAKTLSQDADTIREMNAYTYEFDRDEQCQGYYWGVKRLGYDDPCERNRRENREDAHHHANHILPVSLFNLMPP